jgi:hypothetical protein
MSADYNGPKKNHPQNRHHTSYTKPTNNQPPLGIAVQLYSEATHPPITPVWNAFITARFQTGRPVPVSSLPDPGSLIKVGVEVQVVTTALAPTPQQQDKQLLPPEQAPEEQRCEADGRVVVFGTESGSSFVACQASDKNSKSHLSPASWEEDQTIYGAI